MEPTRGNKSRGRSGRLTGGEGMRTIDEAIEGAVPVRGVYDQRKQFEEFPQFMEGVESVIQIDETNLRWIANIAGVRREWDATITEQHPNLRVAWTSTDGTDNSGVVTFHRLDYKRTRVRLQLDVEPRSATEQIGDKLGLVRRRVRGDLERFKELVESRGYATGGWHGDVEREDA